MIPRLFAVIRYLPDEHPELRSAWVSEADAERTRKLEDYRVRNLEGFESCRHEIREYVPTALHDALAVLSDAFFSPERLARDELNAAAEWHERTAPSACQLADELRRRASDPHLGENKPEAP